MINEIYAITFWLSIIFVVLGGVLGLTGVWFADFWKNDVGWRLILTDFILAGSSIGVALITKLLR